MGHEWLIRHKTFPNTPMDNANLNDRYQLTQLLGRKAGRRTWLAIDQQTQQQVVIKLLLFSADFEWDALKLFEREAQTLQDLDHVAIPKYLDWFEMEFEGSAGFALVQTHIPALSLETIVRAGRTFSSDELQQIAEQVLDILDYLHSRNPPVIHRDLKPSNILLGDRTGNSPGKVSLVDFGAVQNLAGSKGGTITIVGTYGYMPMEQFGDRAVPASDLYSLGATMLYLATGKDPADLLADDSQLQVDGIANLSSELSAWIRQLTQMNLKDRPASATIARELLHQSPDLEDLTRSTSNPLAARIPCPENSRFYVHTLTPEILTLCFANFRIRIRRLPGNDVSGGCLWWILGSCVALPLVFQLWALGWIGVAVISGLTWLVVWLTIRNRQCTRIIKIDRANIHLSDRLYQDPAVLAQRDQSTSPDARTIRQEFWDRMAQSVPKHKVWEITYNIGSEMAWEERFLRQDLSYVQLKIGQDMWELRGNSREIRWLVGELSHYLQIPPIGSNLNTRGTKTFGWDK
jgi:serine/threonine protein kinase